MAEAVPIASFTWPVQNLEQLRNHEVSLQSYAFPLRFHSISTILKKEYFSIIKWRLSMTIREEPAAAEDTEKSHDREHIALFARQTVTFRYRPLPIFKVTFSIKNPLRGKVFSKSKILFDVRYGQYYGFSKFISIEELEDLELKDFQIQCDFEEIEQNFEISKLMYVNKEFSDINLRVGDKTFLAHKLILALQSTVFREKFASQDSISHLEVPKIESGVFADILKYIYIGNLEIPQNSSSLSHVAKIFVAAISCGFEDLGSLTEKILNQGMKMCNVVPFLLLCDYDQKRFRDRFYSNPCIRFIRSNFKEFMNSEQCEVLVMKEPRFLIPIIISIGSESNISRKGCKRKHDAIVDSDVPEPYDKYYGTFFNDQTLSDVEIHIDKRKFRAHKLVLAAKSPVFRKMFATNMIESISGVVKIEDVEPSIFEELLRFMYTNEIKNMSQPETVFEILIVADKYEVDPLKSLCEKILTDLLTWSNVFQVLLIADKYNVKQLKSNCIIHIIDGLFSYSGKSRSFEEEWCNLLARELAGPRLLLELAKKLASD